MSETELRRNTVELIPPMRCRCCFTVQGVAISSISVLVTMAILVFVLDFTILEVYVRQERIHAGKHELFQDGGVFDQEDTWDRISRIKIIDFSNVEVNVSLLHSFITTAYKMERVRLRNLTLFGMLPKMRLESSYRAYQLKEFLLELNHPVGPLSKFRLDDCDECIVDNITSVTKLRSIRCLRALLFYINIVEAPAVKLVEQMATANISITVYGRTLLRVVQDESERIQLTSMFTDCEILLSLWDDQLSRIRQLSLSGCTNLNVTKLETILSSGNLTQLTLNNCTITGQQRGQRLSQIFQNAASSLQALVLNMELTVPRVVSLNDFPVSLKTLVVGGCVLVNSTASAVRLNLDTLRLNNVVFGDDLSLTSFPNGITFKKLAFRQLRSSTGGLILEQVDLWSSFLHRVMASSSWVWLENPFYRSSASAHRSQESNSELTAWRVWMRKKGIDDTILLQHDPAFVLEKDTEGKWAVESRSHGVVTGQKDPNDAVWFHYLRMGNFLRDDLWSTVEW